MPDHYSKLRLAIPPVLADDVLHGVAVVMDEIRSMEASFDELSQIASKIGGASSRFRRGKRKNTV